MVRLFNSVRKQQRELEEKLEDVSEIEKSKGVYALRLIPTPPCIRLQECGVPPCLRWRRCYPSLLTSTCIRPRVCKHQARVRNPSFAPLRFRWLPLGPVRAIKAEK